MEDEVLIPTCVAVIEGRLGWGPGGQWAQGDFEKLSDIIQAETGVLLSVTTLKRVWGRVKYESRPTVTTLNALAKFAGFESWRVFAQQAIGEGGAAFGASAAAGQRRSMVGAWVSGVVVVTLVSLFVSFNKGGTGHKEAIAIDERRFSFTLNKMVTNGVPNSVVFKYDATAAVSDSIYISQTWDISRKTLVPKDAHYHSAIYYYPGYFRTKLMVGNRIVQTKDLQITTDGWLALAEGNPIPVYFKKEEYWRDGVVRVDSQLLRRYNIANLPRATPIRIYNQRDMGGLMNDNFVFETKVRNTFDLGDNVCQQVQVMIQCKDDIIIIPLSAKGCVGKLRLYAAGASVDSRTADLSRFGCDLHEWVDLRVECVNRTMLMLVNGVEAYVLTIPNAATGIVGVQYRFNGLGEVKGARFEGEGKKIEL